MFIWKEGTRMKDPEEIRNYLRTRAKYLMVPNKGKYENYFFPESSEVLRLPIVPGSTYGTWSLNEHHFKPFYHFEYILPAFATLCNFTFRKDDFSVVERKSGEYDTTYLCPKQEYSFEVYGYSRQEHFKDKSFAFLASGTSGTDYHKQYRYYHECGRIINHSLNSDKILFISGDSTVIPDVPVLACLFKEVWYFDNRDHLSHIVNFRDVEGEGSVVFQVGFAFLNKYCVDNLR